MDCSSGATPRAGSAVEQHLGVAADCVYPPSADRGSLSGEQDACQWRGDVTVLMRYCADGDNGAGWDDDRLG